METVKSILKYINNKTIILLFLMLFITSQGIFPQYKFRYDNDHLPDLTLSHRNNDGFMATFSLVAMFTAGAADRDGFRLGAGITLTQTIDNWQLLAGFDTYKAKQCFGLGTSFAGVKYDDGRYGGSYIVNKYYQGDKQVSALMGVHLCDFRINFEDDILAMPFTGFKIYDRYRTAALEVRYKDFMIGTNVYTTDINAITDISGRNSKGVYVKGRQVSSPLYVGYARKGLIMRLGMNNRIGGWLGQNGWHQRIFNTPDFNYANYSNPFIQLGVDKPYTMY